MKNEKGTPRLLGGAERQSRGFELRVGWGWSWRESAHFVGKRVGWDRSRRESAHFAGRRAGWARRNKKAMIKNESEDHDPSP